MESLEFRRNLLVSIWIFFEFNRRFLLNREKLLCENELNTKHRNDGNDS